MTSPNRTLIPIYSTRGDCCAFLAYPYLYNQVGEWIGWVTPERQVYSVHGMYVGWLAHPPRILRKKGEGHDRPHLTPPPAPPRVSVPARVPLPPMMPELSFDTLDILEDDPDLLATVDFGEGRSDLD